MNSNCTSAAKIVAFILAIAMLMANASFSQQIQMPAGVPAPKEALRGKSRVNAPWLTWACSEGAVVRTGPDVNSLPTSLKLKFLQPLKVAFFDEQGNNSNWVLICETVDDESFEIKQLIGWVDKEDLLLNLTPLPIRAEWKSVTRKGMAVITKESLEKFPPLGVPRYPDFVAGDSESNKEAGTKAALFKAPRFPTRSDKPGFVKEIPVSSFYFVYKDSGDFLLIGTNSRFNLTKPEDVLLGWLPKLNHAEWTNRIGFEWNADTYSETKKELGFRRERGFVFRTYRDAANFSKSESPVFSGDPPEEAVYDEAVNDGVPIRLADSALRMPLLQYEAPVNGVSFAKVGWLGGKGVDPEKAAIAKQRIDELARQSRNLDLIFLIDHTQTMETHFPVVANAVQKIVDDLRSKYLGEAGIYGRTMRLSISFYGDEESTDSAAVIRNLQPVTDNTSTQFGSLNDQQRQLWARRSDLSANDMLAELPKHPTFGGGGIEEDVLDGILKAIKKFPPDDSRKLLFVVGDMGDKLHLGEEFKRRRDAIAKLLANDRVPIWFIALQVETTATTANATGRTVAELFRKQMDQVAQETRLRLKSQEASQVDLNFSKVVPLSTQSPVEEILRAYEAIQDEIKRYQEGLINLNPSKLTRWEIKRLEAQGVSLTELQHPLFSQGFVAMSARKNAVTDNLKPTPQVERRVLMSRQDLLNLRDLCEKLLLALESNDAGDEGIGTLMRKEISAIYGESDSLRSVSEAAELMANVKLQNDIFNIPLENLRTASISPKQLAQLQASHKRLVDILDGSEREWALQQDEKKRWRVIAVGPAKKKDRMFTLPHDPFQTPWYWVKESEIP